MLKAQQGVARTVTEQDMGNAAETNVKTEPDTHSEAASLHEFQTVVVS
jgi:hypothetical protein